MTDPQKVAWNRGKVVGKKSPLTPNEMLRQGSRRRSAT
jgi:hypothetical protein